MQARRHRPGRRHADHGEGVVGEQRVLAQRHLVPDDLVVQLRLPVREVVREHAALRVVVGAGGRPLPEQRLVAAVLPLLRLRDRRDDCVPPAHDGTLRPATHRRRFEVMTRSLAPEDHLDPTGLRGFEVRAGLLGPEDHLDSGAGPPAASVDR